MEGLPCDTYDQATGDARGVGQSNRGPPDEVDEADVDTYSDVALEGRQIRELAHA